ncbi:MAG: hypothetical protein R3C45_11940 [Phycisphaerales bacterium]
MPETAIDQRLIEYIVIGAYLAVLVAVGFVFKRFNSNVSDYFRSGCKGTWWLVGSSAFMTSFSAVTFTAMAGAAFESGFGVTIIFIGNAIGFFLAFLFLAPWFRQLRCITAPEIIKMRYGRTTQMFYAWITMILGILYAGLWLQGLAIFTAAIFDFTGLQFWIFDTEVKIVILLVGAVVLIYSVFGGSWAVMATDFLQFLVLMPLTLALAWLALDAVGGVGGFFHMVEARGLTQDFQFINESGHFPADKYTIMFAIATITYKVVKAAELDAAKILRCEGAAGTRARPRAAGGGDDAAGRGRVVLSPDGRQALVRSRRDGAGGARHLQACRGGLRDRGHEAFAARDDGPDGGRHVLGDDEQHGHRAEPQRRYLCPRRLPALVKVTGLPELSERAAFILGQVFSFIFGAIIIGLAYYFSQIEGKGVFELMLNVGAMLALPMGLPLLMAMFIRPAPWWAAIFSVCSAMVPSTIAFFSQGTENEWNYQKMIFWIVPVGLIGYAVTIPFWKFASDSYRKQVDMFFKTMHTPIDFEKEVGAGNDLSQLKIMGSFSAVIGLCICLLVVLPNPWSGRVVILFVGGSVAVVGLLAWLGTRKQAVLLRKMAKKPCQATFLWENRG